MPGGKKRKKKRSLGGDEGERGKGGFSSICRTPETLLTLKIQKSIRKKQAEPVERLANGKGRGDIIFSQPQQLIIIKYIESGSNRQDKG